MEPLARVRYGGGDGCFGRSCGRSLLRVCCVVSPSMKNRMQLTKYSQGGIALPIKRAELPISDYHNNTTWARQGSMLESIGRRTKAMGIKEYAWEGMQSESDDQRLTHHYDKKFLENNHKFQ